MTETLDLFADALQEVANGPHGTDFQALTEGLLRRLSEKGLTLQECAGRKMLNRSVSTLQGHCARFGIRFPDYIPANMRTHIQFAPYGDFLNLTGEYVEAAAAVLDVVVLDGPMCCIPAHGWDDAKVKLRKAGFEAKKDKAPRKRKGRADA